MATHLDCNTGAASELIKKAWHSLPGSVSISSDRKDTCGNEISSGCLETATQAPYFDSFAPGDTVTVKFRLWAKYPIRAGTFKSRVYKSYDRTARAVGSA